MTTSQLLIVCLTVVVLALIAAAVLLLARGRHTIDAHIGRRLVIHLRDHGPSLRGVLIHCDAPDSVCLADAEYLGEHGVVTHLEGRQVLRRDRVEWFQVLADTGAR